MPTQPLAELSGIISNLKLLLIVNFVIFKHTIIIILIN